ncbi:MAG: AEC family transporter, partial [Cruoricaptor ignavus]|nr:AEC family transporter [Cruoricaptor ignavus]
FNWKKLLPPPLIGFLVALVFLLLEIPIPKFVNSTLSYVGQIVTPLSLIYIGIVLCNAGLKSIHFDRDTIAGLLGKFVLAPAIIISLIFIGRGMEPLPLLEEKTLIIQAAIPALAILPILANEAKGDVQYATNIVTTSTILFVLIIPIFEMLLQYL